MSDQQPAGGNRLMPWIVAAVVILLIGAVIFFVGQNRTDDNLVPSATAVDPRSGELTATGTAARSATGAEQGTTALPPVGGVVPGVSGDATFSDPGSPPPNTSPQAQPTAPSPAPQ